MSSTSRPGGRSARVVDAVLRATIEELAARGWSGLQIEAVAERAGVHKTTVYRRWPTRGALVADAIAATPFRSLGAGVPETGSLRGDLAALTDDAVAVWAEPRTRLAARTLVAARDDPEVVAAFGGYWRAQIERIVTVVERAKAVGEVPEAVDAEFVAEVYLGTGLFHLVELDRELTPDWVEMFLDVTCAAAGS